MGESVRPASRHRRAARWLVVAALAVLVGVASIAGPAGTARAAAPATFVLQGTVRDENGTPVPGVDVFFDLPKDEGKGYHVETEWTVTDADGHYAFRELPRPSSGFSWARLVASRPQYTAADSPSALPSMLQTLRGPALDVDLRVRGLTATVRGHVSVRGGASPSGGSVTLYPTRPVAGDPDSYWAGVAADGAWEARVPPGTYRVSASSTYGLPGWAPDLPQPRQDASPPVVVGSGETRGGVDVSLRARMKEFAYDEYGTLQDGFDERGWIPGAALGTYPIDPYRTSTSTVGPHVRIEARLDNRAWTLSIVNLRITNTGDDTAFIDPVRFSGGDRFTCWFSAEGPCEPTFVLPGTYKDVLVAPLFPYGDAPKERYATTAIVPTARPAGTVRVPVAVRLPPQAPDTSSASMTKALQQQWLAAAAAAATATGAHAPIARPGARGDVGRVLVSRSRLRVTFPAAGTATSLIDRSVRRTVAGATRRRWRTVRRATVRAAGATTSSSPLKRLARGRYRVRTTYAIGARAPRTTTTYWTLRR